MMFHNLLLLFSIISIFLLQFEQLINLPWNPGLSCVVLPHEQTTDSQSVPLR